MSAVAAEDDVLAGTDSSCGADVAGHVAGSVEDHEGAVAEIVVGHVGGEGAEGGPAGGVGEGRQFRPAFCALAGAWVEIAAVPLDTGVGKMTRAAVGGGAGAEDCGGVGEGV